MRGIFEPIVSQIRALVAKQVEAIVKKERKKSKKCVDALQKRLLQHAHMTIVYHASWGVRKMFITAQNAPFNLQPV